MIRLIAAAMSIVIAGCSYAVSDPVTGGTMAKCYAGANNAFCIVRAPAGYAILPGSPIVPALTGSAALLSLGAGAFR